ncbi:hypothetical protein HWV62_14322 [Athelia sp. TMB]|nr:hypothetical protein HWV62_14322 [Athelia sp. TMB]
MYAALTDQVQRLSQKIRAAEVRLKQLSKNSQAQPPPVKVENLDELSNAIGQLIIGESGKATYHGGTASSEVKVILSNDASLKLIDNYLQYLEELAKEKESDEAWDIRDPIRLGMPLEIIKLFRAFPMGLSHCSSYHSHFTEFLPGRDRAIELTNLYYRLVAWMYDPVLRSDFMDTIIAPLYATSQVASIGAIHPHQLSVFFAVMASGALWDDHPSAKILAHQYHVLSRAALSLKPIIFDASTATVQAIFTIIRFLHISDLTAGEERWILGSTCTKMAQIPLEDWSP